MDPLMKDAALGGKPIFQPLLLNMDQGALARAEQKMLQGRDHHQIILAVEAGSDFQRTVSAI
jgi:hypothetical protein